jgi:hypothetical protein
MFLNLHLSISHTQQTHTHTQHPVGLHRMVDQPIAEAAHNKHKRRTSMSAAEFEPAILAIKWLQTYALGRTATGVGWIQIIAGADSPKLTTRFHLVPMSGTRGTFKLCTSYVTMVGFVCNDAVQVLMKYCVTDCTQHFSIAWLTVVAVSGLVLWEIASTKGRCVCVCVCVVTLDGTNPWGRGSPHVDLLVLVHTACYSKRGRTNLNAGETRWCCCA